MHRYIKYMAVALLGAVTLLALYAAAHYVVPQVLNWLIYLLIILLPFMVALLISVLLEPFIEFLQQVAKFPRTLAVLTAMLAVLGGIGYILTAVTLRLVAELMDLSMVVPRHMSNIQNYLENMFTKGQLFYLTLPDQITVQLEQFFNLENVINTIGSNLQNLAQSMANFLLAILYGLPEVIILIIITLVAIYFLSRDRKEIAKFWVKVMPAPWGENSLEIGHQVTRAFIAYIRAMLILVLISSVISFVGLSIMGIEYALTIALLVGLMELLPVVGPGGVFVPWGIWSLIIGNYALGFKLLGLYLILLVIRSMIEAKVVAINLGLHPLSVLLSMYAGLKIIGVLGLVLGPILVITAQAIIRACANIRSAS